MVSCEFIIESGSYLLVIKHGLLENPPFSWMIFPFQCPFYRGFPRSPTPFLDVLRQLPGRKAVAAAILFRCAGHAGGHVVLPTGRSQRVPQIFWCWGGSSTPKKSRDVWWIIPKKRQNKYIRNVWWLPRKARSAWAWNLTRIARIAVDQGVPDWWIPVWWNVRCCAAATNGSLFVFETCKPVLAITAKQVDALLDTVVQYLGGISNSLSCMPKKLAC